VARHRNARCPPWRGFAVDAGHDARFYLPAGFLCGSQLLPEADPFTGEVTYFHYPPHEITVLWNDPGIGIDWPPADSPRLSDKDANAVPLGDVTHDRITRY